VGTLLIIGVVAFILYSVLGGTGTTPPTVSDVTSETLHETNTPATVYDAEGSGDTPPLHEPVISQGGLTTPTPYPGSDSVFQAGVTVKFGPDSGPTAMET
jgi:hypothetical protein